MFTIIDRYIAYRITVATAMVLAVLLTLMSFYIVVDALPDYGRGNFGLWEFLRYVLLAQPRKIYELFPVAVLIGALLGLASLAVNAELTAMRAAGLSVARIVLSATRVGMAFALLVLLVGEYVVPVAEDEAQLGRAQALAQGVRKEGSGLWLRDRSSFVRINEVLPDLSLVGVNIYAFDDNAQLRTHTFATRARFRRDEWILNDVQESVLGKDRVETRTHDRKPWDTSLTGEVVRVFMLRPEGMSIQHLLRYINHLAANGQTTERYRLVLWQKALMPLAVIVMVLLAAPFAFGNMRTGGMGGRIFSGIVLGLVFVLANRLVGHFGLLYGLPPFLGAALPIALFFVGTLWLLRRVS
jgi:lipopolysaccharide export system permease protein